MEERELRSQHHFEDQGNARESQKPNRLSQEAQVEVNANEKSDQQVELQAQPNPSEPEAGQAEKR